MLNTTELAVTTIAYSLKIDRIWGSIGLLCGAFTIVGNLFVFAILIRLPKRTLSDCAFINLSIIDTISGVAAIAGSWFLLDDRTWVVSTGTFHTVTCYMAGMTWNAASLTTPLLVSVVSIGRMAAVYLPLKYDKIFTSLVVYSMLTYCWLHGVVASTLSLWGDTGAGKYALYRGWGYCDQSIRDAYSNESTFTALYMTFFTIPMMLTCSCIVFCNLFVMGKIIKMKIKPDPHFSLTEQNSTTQIMLSKIERFSRRISRVSTVQRLSTLRSYKPSTAIPPDQSFQSSNNSSCPNPSNYRHFEIVSVEETSETTFNSNPATDSRSSSRRRQSKAVKMKSFQRQKRARRENRAIFMTFLVSISYLVCYMEIINFYTLASFTESPRTLFDKVLGIKPETMVETYVYLWYYFSLFAAAATNVLLHFLFNHVVRRGLSAKGRRPSVAGDGEGNRRSSMKSNTATNGHK